MLISQSSECGRALTHGCEISVRSLKCGHPFDCGGLTLPSSRLTFVEICELNPPDSVGVLSSLVVKWTQTGRAVIGGRIKARKVAFNVLPSSTDELELEANGIEVASGIMQALVKHLGDTGCGNRLAQQLGKMPQKLSLRLLDLGHLAVPGRGSFKSVVAQASELQLAFSIFDLFRRLGQLLRGQVDSGLECLELFSLDCIRILERRYFPRNRPHLSRQTVRSLAQIVHSVQRTEMRMES